MVDFNLLAAQYKSELLDRVMPFWMENSIDKEFGSRASSETVRSMTPTSSFGCKAVRCGCSLHYIIR